MKVIIVDDEQNARLALQGILSENFPEVEVLDLCKDVQEAVKSIHKYKPDLVFLDISMPGYSGLDFVDFFEKESINFNIIFVTAHAEFALNAFELNALDYLLKPIKISALERALNKFKTLKPYDKNTINQPDSNKKIALQTGDGILFLELNQILYLKADGSYTQFFTSDGKKITISKKLAEFQKLENIGSFMRIHRSHMVNINQIQKFLKQDGGTIIMNDGAELSISNEKKQVLMDLFLDNKL